MAVGFWFNGSFLCRVFFGLSINFPHIVSSALICSHLLPSGQIRESQRVFKSSVFFPDPCETPRNKNTLWLTQTPRVSALGISHFGPHIAEFSRFRQSVPRSGRLARERRYTGIGHDVRFQDVNSQTLSTRQRFW